MSSYSLLDAKIQPGHIHLPKMTSLVIGKSLLSLMAVSTSVGPFLADFK
jgi:hypothetical protein